MERATTTRTPAAAALDAQVVHVRRQLAALAEIVDKAADQPDATWADAGSLTHLGDLLGEALAHYGRVVR